jgi:dienelactone hydrolase
MSSRNTLTAFALFLALLFFQEYGEAMQGDPDPSVLGDFSVVETSFSSGGLHIAATLLLPDGDGPHPGVVLIQGSGPSSRKNAWSLMIGQELASRGVAAFLPDKRGTGDSDGEWETAGFAELASDVVAAVDALAALPEIDAGHVGVIGLSQGGFYAPLVAVATGIDKVGFVGAVSPSLVRWDQTINHEMSNTFREVGLSGRHFELAVQVQKAALDFVRGGSWEEYSGIRQVALAETKSDVIAGFPEDRDAPMWTGVRKMVGFDPIPHWGRVTQPMFFAFGEEDEEDNVPVAASIERIRDHLEPTHDVTFHLYPKSGHALWDPALAEHGEAAIRQDFSLNLVEWILSRR